MSAIAKCIGCGCDDLHACWPGCHWLVVDRRAGRGVCSECPDRIRQFKPLERKNAGSAASNTARADQAARRSRSPLR